MTPRPVLVWPDARLRAVAAAVTAFDAGLAALAEEMLAVMYGAAGRGLAATQIGVMQRVFVMDSGWKDGAPVPRVFVNPVLVEQSEHLVGYDEGCLSLPGVVSHVLRPDRVVLRWQGLAGAVAAAEFTGFEAVCVQHEADHLDGVLCRDRAVAA